MLTSSMDGLIPSSSLLSCMPLSESQSVYYVVFSYGVNPTAAAKFEAAFAHATGNTKRPISRGCQTLLLEEVISTQWTKKWWVIFSLYSFHCLACQLEWGFSVCFSFWMVVSRCGKNVKNLPRFWQGKNSPKKSVDLPSSCLTHFMYARRELGK